jgi:class 3 adenylate cyclase/phosphoglycerate-specific signal transduction histidine kinase
MAPQSDLHLAASARASTRQGRSRRAETAIAAGASRHSSGIKARLLAAFGAMALLTLSATGVAWYAFSDVKRSVAAITKESVVSMAASLRFAEKSAEITAIAPALMAAGNEQERLRQASALTQRLDELAGLADALRAAGVAEERLARLGEIAKGIASGLDGLSGAVARRLLSTAQREASLAGLLQTHDQFDQALEPLVDDAGFNLIVASDQVTAESKDAIAKLIEGGVNELQALLTLRAEAHLIAGLLSSAANADDPALIGPVHERFEAAAATVDQALRALAQSSDSDRLRTASGALVQLGIGAENLFDLRLQELAAQADLRDSMQAKRSAIAVAVDGAHNAVLRTLEPLIDDASFNLVLAGEETSAGRLDGIDGTLEDQITRFQALLNERADSDLVAAILAAAALETDQAQMQPLRERFVAAAANAQKSTENLPDGPERARLNDANAALTALGSGDDNLFDARAQELRAATVMRETLQAKRATAAAAVETLHEALLKVLEPLVDDAGFNLIVSSDQFSADSKAAIQNLVEGGVSDLQSLLTLRAEGNLIAGLLNEASGVADRNALEPLRDRFVAAADHVRKLNAGLPDGNNELSGLVQNLGGFGIDEGDIFDIRHSELQQIVDAQHFLAVNNALVLELGDEVARLVAAAQDKSDSASAHAIRAIRNGQLFLSLITVLSAVAAAVIVTRYVVPRVIRPLEDITTAMSGLAAGDTSIDIPGRDRRDELGRMAQALGVFRDTAIELQKSNLREIEEGRQRLGLAIESISEAFSLFDRDDRLVVFNRKYKTLLYADELVPLASGMTFESIIRHAAAQGWIKEAEGRIEEWIGERMAQHHAPYGQLIQQRGDGRWVLISERKTDDGGTVALYSDITDLKERENELAQKSMTLENLSRQLSKFLAPQVYDSIFTGKQEARVTGQRKKLTVFFSDIAGFTETTDRMESEDLTYLLNHYLTEMSQIALSYGATIDKYVGDAIVIFFGDPESRGIPEDALACVEMAIAMQKRMTALQAIWRASGIERPLKCRIGINTGFCTVGNFGSENRMDYTIIGGGVNLASRLEAAAEPGQILLSYETYAHVRDRIDCIEQGQISVKGIAYPVATYRALDLREHGRGSPRVIDEECVGMRLMLDFESISADERRRIVAVLSRALERLSGDELPDAPGSIQPGSHSTSSPKRA